MLACQLPKSHWEQVPLSVSVVENVCDTATNNLKVRYNKLPEGETKKQNFAVCVKGLDFPTEDLSVRLIEWFELLHLLGANKIFLYNLEVHPNVTKVLNYYEKKGYVDVTPISLPGKDFFLSTHKKKYLPKKVQFDGTIHCLPFLNFVLNGGARKGPAE